jgi:transcriptional regulator with PAS, ATPase and Fis domain
MSAGPKDQPTPTVPIATGAIEPAPIGAVPRRRVFLLVSHADGVAALPLVPGESVVVGRAPPADLALDDKNLSPRHARFTLVAPEQVAVEDLGSTSGTRVGGKRIEEATIRPGELVLLGSATASVLEVAGDDPRPLGLESHDVFRAAASAELERARFFNRPLAVLTVRAIERQVGSAVGWYPRARTLLRPVDRAALYGADIVEILLPEASSAEVLGIARALADPSRAGVALACGVAFFPGTASADELLESSLEAARRATAADPVQAAVSEGHRTVRGGQEDDEGLVMESPAMREAARTAARLANAASPVLIHGETGAGKEVLARLIHANGPRRDKPLVSVSCAAIPVALLESTLFGHEKGSFTGADRQRKGLFEAAEGGSILLDEIGELPAAAQAALLRVLEEKRVQRVGSTREVEVDVRVLAATHRDLEAMCDAGAFRRDLLFRLSATVVTLPPLRARQKDIGPLAMRFLRRAAKANGCDVRAISPEAMAQLERYTWPGNVRELRSVMERAVVIAEGDTIRPSDLPERLRARGAPAAAPQARYTGSLKSRMEAFERDTILDVLREANNKLADAARRLEVPVRTLQQKVNALGINRALDFQPDDPDE